MPHEPVVATVVGAEFGQVVGERIALVEESLENGIAGRQGMAGDMNDVRAWQCARDQTAVEIVERYLDGETRPVLRPAARTLDIVVAEGQKIHVRRGRYQLLARDDAATQLPADGLDHRDGKVIELAGGRDRRMTRQDALDERR